MPTKEQLEEENLRLRRAVVELVSSDDLDEESGLDENTPGEIEDADGGEGD